MLLYKPGYLEDKEEQREKRAYTKKSKKIRSREAFVRKYSKPTKKKSNCQEKPSNIYLIPHELRIEFALSNFVNFTTSNNIIINNEVANSVINELHYKGRVLDSKLINSLKYISWRTQKNKDIRFKKLSDIINNRKEIIIYESKIDLNSLDLIPKEELKLLNKPKKSFIYDTNERIENINQVCNRLNGQTKKLQAIKKRTEKKIEKNGVSTKNELEKIKEIDRNCLILNEINNKLHKKEWNLEYEFNPLISNLTDKKKQVEKEIKDENLTRKQKRNRKYKEHLKKVSIKGNNIKKNIKGIMRAIEHNVLYNNHEVNFDRLNEEYKKLDS